MDGYLLLFNSLRVGTLKMKKSFVYSRELYILKFRECRMHLSSTCILSPELTVLRKTLNERLFKNKIFLFRINIIQSHMEGISKLPKKSLL